MNTLERLALTLALNAQGRRSASLRRRIMRTQCYIDSGVVVTRPERFEAGPGSALYAGTYLLNTNGRVRIGASSHLGARCFVNAAQGQVLVGDHVAIGPFTALLSYSNHYEPGQLVTETKITADVVIGNNVFIGAHCTVLPGAVVGDNVVIGAGSVVKGELREGAVYGGSPARLLRSAWAVQRPDSDDQLADR